MAKKVTPSEYVLVLNEKLAENGADVVAYLYPEGAGDADATGIGWEPKSADSSAAVSKAQGELAGEYQTVLPNQG